MTTHASLSHPFKFLRHTITILVVDDRPDELSESTLGLAKIEFFNVIGVSTARDAVEIFQSTGRVQVCLMELSIRDMNDDEFFLSKKFSSNTRFIGITRIRSCSMGYKAIRNGFSEVFDKPINLTELIRCTFRNAMINIFVPHSKPLQKSAIDRTIAVLMEHSPATVDQWASAIRITACTLREQWDKSGIPPKSVLFIWTLFNTAAEYYLGKAFSRITDEANENKTALFQKLHDKYYLKRYYWLDIIKGVGGFGYETSFYDTVATSSSRRAPGAVLITTA